MKSYRQFCSVAKTLDVVGDRWALLVVRELLLGPRRYTDLLEGLPGVGTNVLATRLRELEEAGIVARHRLPSPTPITLYELTRDGRDLRPVIDALARWGARQLTKPGADDVVAGRWFVLWLAAVFGIDVDDGVVFELHLDGEVFTLTVNARRLSARYGAAAAATATLVGTLPDFYAATLGDRAAARRITVKGDRRAGRRLVDAMTHPTAANGRP